MLNVKSKYQTKLGISNKKSRSIPKILSYKTNRIIQTYCGINM
jgi:hypothetical protein